MFFKINIKGLHNNNSNLNVKKEEISMNNKNIIQNLLMK